jgi:hypothetical protein
MRGGWWIDGPVLQRAAQRLVHPPGIRNWVGGMRLVHRLSGDSPA